MAEIPKLVSQRLQTMAQLKDHPEPNLLSAFVERSLGKGERVQVLEHLSWCANCRELVSLSATHRESSAAVSIIPGSSGWFSWPALRWGAAVACVVIVGAAVSLHQKWESRPTTAMVEARPSVATKLGDDNATAAAVGGNGNHPVTASPVEMADARAGSPLPQVVPGRAKEPLAELQDGQPEKSMNAHLARSGSIAPGNLGNAITRASLLPRWTLSSDGTLQRSLDSGASWQTIVVSTETAFRALAANGLDIWVGGSAGALFHSSDAGVHWTQVRPVANNEALEGDIIGVEFTDTLHGKLTSSTGQIWITADAGQTWHKE